ncbi:MAG: sialidase family protein [Planctomycetota bacterium]
MRPIRLASLLPVVGALALAAEHADAQVLPKTRINVGGANGTGTDGIGFAERDGAFYIAWAERNGQSASQQDIFFSSSFDDGVSWTTPVRVDTGDLPNVADSDQPRLVVTENGTVVVIFQEFRDSAAAGAPTEADCYYNRSTDGGVTWMPAAMPLNTTTAGPNISSDIDRIFLASSGNRVFATWEEDEASPNVDQIKFVTSTDAGATWTTPALITSTMPIEDVDDPKVAGNGANVVVAFIDDNGGDEDLEILNSTNGGLTWTQQAVETSTNGDADTARIASDGDVFAVAWFDDDVSGGNDNEVHAVVSTDGGVTWSAEITLNPSVGANAPATTHDIALWVDGDDVYCVYTDDSAAVAGGGTSTINAGELYLSRSLDGGVTWDLEIAIDDDADLVNARPHMAARNGRVVVHSETGSNGNNLLAYYVSEDFGTTWSEEQLVPNAGADVDSEDDNNGRVMAISSVTGTAISAFWDNNSPTTDNEVYISGIDGDPVVGTNYCGPGNPNSTGNSGRMAPLGSTFVADNDVLLRAVDLPNASFGFFITSTTQGFVANPGGSDGNLCVGGAIGRYVGPGQIQNSGNAGEIELQLDLTQTPTPTGFVSVQPGETRNYQAWHRDSGPSGPTSNFTDGSSITFQ